MLRKIGALCTAGITLLVCNIVPVQAMEGGMEVSNDDHLAQMVVRVRHCTGTAIASHWVLTAKHCFPDETRKSYVHLGIERNRGETGIVIDRFVEADKTFFMSNSDVALLHTVQDMQLPRYAELNFDSLQPATNGIGYGWGKGTADKLKRGELAIKQAGRNTHYGPAIEAYHKDDSNTQSGDSGGPLFIDQKIVGVASFKPSYSSQWIYYSQLNGLENLIMQTRKTAIASETDQGPFQRKWNNGAWEQLGAADASEPAPHTGENTGQLSLPGAFEEETEKPDVSLTVPAPINSPADASSGEGHTPPRQETKGIAGIILGVLAGLGGFGALIAFLINYMKGLI